jgi:hypothetical protein
MAVSRYPDFKPISTIGRIYLSHLRRLAGDGLQHVLHVKLGGAAGISAMQDRQKG